MMTVVQLDDFRPAAGVGRRESIWARVLSRCKIHMPRGDQAEGCWEWLGGDSGKPKPKNAARGHSYGRMSLDGNTMAVHIVMWVLVNGPIPPRKQLDHLGCWTRRCCNPSHLEMVTHKRNQKRRDERRKLTCEAA